MGRKLGGSNRHRNCRLFSDDEKPRFAVRFDQILFEKHISNRTLCHDTGLDNRAVSRWLHEWSEPHASDVVIIAKYFGVSTDWLLGVKEERN